MSKSNLKVRVARKATEAIGICTFQLAGVDASPLPGYSAGSHIDVHLPNGLTRQYSLCNDAGESHHYLIAVLKEDDGRGGSKALHESVQEGDELEISLPKNHFPLAHAARRSLLFAAGIGITPILCMAERLAIAGEEFELHYSTRSREHTAFLERIRSSAFADRTHLHFSNGDPANRLDIARAVADPQPGMHLYVCGPKRYMEAVLDAARAAGWAADQVHHEFFAGEVAQRADDGSFQVKLASSGRIIMIPKDKTVTQALGEAGVAIETSCEQGVCGTCLTRVIEGIPDHRDMYLSSDEQSANDQFLPCCSRACSPMLVLDL